MTENPKTCQKCGSPVTPGMKFCESCGAKIEALPAGTGAPTACPKCGAAIVPGMMSCSICGADVGPAAAPVQEKTAAAAPVSVPATPPAPPAPAPAPVNEPPKTGKATDASREAGPKKTTSKTPMIIAGVVILALLGAAVYFVGLPMLSGSGTPSPGQQQQPVTAGPAASSGVASATAGSGQAGTVELTAGPTDALPSNRALIIDVERNAISHDITVTFQGGEGQYGVSELAVTLTRSDGTVERKSLTHLERGSSITLKGTEKSDRVEVTANFYNGETYKVTDKVFEYKKRVGSS